MGLYVGCVKGFVSGVNMKKWVVENIMFFVWCIGWVVVLVWCVNIIDIVVEFIIEEVGGVELVKVLFKGKIVGVECVLRMGYVYGEVKIELIIGDDVIEVKKEMFIIFFKNENIYVKRVNVDGIEEIVVMVLDLIIVFDV